jgi:hypothetical protein
MTYPPHVSRERGIALVLVMLLTVAVAALAMGAIWLTGSTYMISRGQQREMDMRNAADAGIELGRSALNGNPALLPNSSYVALQTDQPVYDASGNVIPRVSRSVYVGPTGSSTGQYGIFGSVVSVINDPSGAVVVRRGELAQESFAKFAYYTNSEGSGICFGGGDQIFGPLHTNDNMCIYSSGARFRGTVEVAGSISGANYGTFDQGYTAHGSVIPLPSVAVLANLATYATQGGMNFTAPAGGSSTQSTLRIEFVALDLAGNGRVTDPDDGFFRVFVANSAANADYVTGTAPNYQSRTNDHQATSTCSTTPAAGSPTPLSTRRTSTGRALRERSRRPARCSAAARPKATTRRTTGPTPCGAACRGATSEGTTTSISIRSAPATSTPSGRATAGGRGCSTRPRRARR